MNLLMTNNFNSYIESPSADFWRDLCLREGVLRHFDKGEDFFTEGQVARYFGYIKSGTLKYVTFGDDGTEHVIGLGFCCRRDSMRDILPFYGSSWGEDENRPGAERDGDDRYGGGILHRL